MTAAIFLIFCVVYLGMILGGLPFLQLDRTGVALLGAIALIGVEALSPEEAAKSIHLPTLILLFSFMVVSAQMRLGGFYTWVTRALAALPLSPPLLLAALILVVAALSAVFSNDVVCLAVAPVLIEACLARRLDPVPYLLALACAANVGSAATLIGNPQNMLIGETLKLSFGGYIAQADRADFRRRPEEVGRHGIGLAEAGRRRLALISRGSVETRRGKQHCSYRREGQKFALVHLGLLFLSLS